MERAQFRIDLCLPRALALLRSVLLARACLTVLFVLGLLAASVVATAQPPANVVRVGYLSDATLAVKGPLIKAFLQGMRDLGYVEGQNLVMEYRFAEGSYDRLPSLAAELIQTKPDVILTSASAAARAAKQATATIPIVMVAIANPVGQGLVASFAQPGGNVTGLSGQYEDLVRKMPELLNDMVPKASQIAVLADGAIPATVGFLRESQTTAQALGVKLLPVEVRGPNDFDGAFSTVMKGRPDALITLPSSLLYFQHKRIADFAKAGGLPAIGPWAEFAEAGGLMSYGLNLPEFYRRAATYVDKILKGAKPGDLPVEQPTQFELVINLKTARTLGVTIPQSVLMRADKVIE